MRRLNKRGVAVVALAVGVLAGSAVTKGLPSVADDCVYETVRVSHGETVDELIRVYNQGKDVDYRDLREVFKEENGTVSIKAGHTYKVPVYNN